MRFKVVLLISGLALVEFSSVAIAEDLVIFPAKGQAAEQQAQDEMACQGWAKQNTGIDPIALASEAAQPPPVSAAPPAPEQPGGQRVRGAARGAAVGAAIGAIAGDAGKGAAIGAVGGGAAGGARKRQAENSAEQAQAQAQAQAQQQTQAKSADLKQQLATFNKSYAACLEGKGYTVK